MSQLSTQLHSELVPILVRKRLPGLHRDGVGHHEEQRLLRGSVFKLEKKREHASDLTRSSHHRITCRDGKQMSGSTNTGVHSACSSVSMSLILLMSTDS